MKCSKFIKFSLLLVVLISPTLVNGAWWPKHRYYEAVTPDSVYVTVRALNVRSCPATHCHVKDVLYQGDMARLIRYKGSWAKIQLLNGYRGWVSARYLSSRPVVRYAPEPDEEVVIDVVESTEKEVKRYTTGRVLYLDELTEMRDKNESQSELLDADDIFN